MFAGHFSDEDHSRATGAVDECGQNVGTSASSEARGGLASQPGAIATARD